METGYEEQGGGSGTLTEEEVLLVWTMRRVGGPWLHSRKCSVSLSPSDRMWIKLIPGRGGESEELRPGFNSRDNYTHKHTHAHTPLLMYSTTQVYTNNR